MEYFTWKKQIVKDTFLKKEKKMHAERENTEEVTKKRNKLR